MQTTNANRFIHAYLYSNNQAIKSDSLIIHSDSVYQHSRGTGEGTVEQGRVAGGGG
jgi:hypothetical protein